MSSSAARAMGDNAQGSGLLGSLVIGAPSDEMPLPISRSVLIALVVEALLLAALAVLLLNASAKAERPKEQPVNIVIEDPPVKKLPPEIPRPEPKLVIKAKPVLPPPVKIAAPTPPVVAQAPAPQTPPGPPAPPEPVVAPAPAVVSQVQEAPPAPPPPPPPPQKTNEAAAREAEFAARVKAAIQAAVVYPAAARSMGFSGKARVEFHLRDGVTSQIRVIQGSGINMIDRAAMDAVTRASYPQAPDTLRGKDQVYQVTVAFDLNSAR